MLSNPSEHDSTQETSIAYPIGEQQLRDKILETPEVSLIIDGHPSVGTIYFMKQTHETSSSYSEIDLFELIVQIQVNILHELQKNPGITHIFLEGATSDIHPDTEFRTSILDTFLVKEAFTLEGDLNN